MVREHIAKGGRQLSSWNADPRVYPSLWFDGDSALEWVVVCSVRYPETEANRPSVLTELKAHFDKLGNPGHFASVSVIAADDLSESDEADNGDVLPLYRGHGMYVRFTGLEPI